MKNPQTNGICGRFHKTILDESYIIAFTKKIYQGIEELQQDLDDWLVRYNTKRAHQGKTCQGRKPTETFLDNLPSAKQEMLGIEGGHRLALVV
jgi:hypothetical protein